MNDEFIILTTGTENPYPIIVRKSNIASVHTSTTPPLQTVVTLNFAVGTSSTPKTIFVSETFEQIKTMLGL